MEYIFKIKYLLMLTVIPYKGKQIEGNNTVFNKKRYSVLRAYDLSVTAI